MNLNNRINTIRSATTRSEAVNEGLRTYMLSVYNFMGSGVLLTGLVSLLFFKLAVITDATGNITGLTGLGNAMYNSSLMWVIALAPLGVVMYMSFGINSMSSSRAQTVFWIFAALMQELSVSCDATAINDLVRHSSFLSQDCNRNLTSVSPT